MSLPQDTVLSLLWTIFSFSALKLLEVQYLRDSRAPRLHLQLPKPLTVCDTRSGSAQDVFTRLRLAKASARVLEPAQLPCSSTAQLLQSSYLPRQLLIANHDSSLPTACSLGRDSARTNFRDTSLLGDWAETPEVLHLQLFSLGHFCRKFFQYTLTVRVPNNFHY